MTFNSDISFASSILSLNFPHATPAVVWRLDLAKTPSFQFSLNDNDALLFRSSPDAGLAHIAHFASSGEAANALAEISMVLGHTGRGPKNPARRKEGWVKRILRLCLMMLGILFILFTLYSCVMVKVHQNINAALISSMQSAAQAQKPKDLPSGQSVPADEFLSDPAPAAAPTQK